MMQAMLQQLANIHNAPCANFDGSVANTDYQTWKQHFTWEALQGLRYGQSFCNRFGMTDNILFYERDHVRADQYIQKTYLLK